MFSLNQNKQIVNINKKNLINQIIKPYYRLFKYITKHNRYMISEEEIFFKIDVNLLKKFK